jgi:DNA recombination protein RmuC
MEIIQLLLGAAVGGAIAWLLAKSNSAKELSAVREAGNDASTRLSLTEKQLSDSEAARSSLQSDHARLSTDYARLEAQYHIHKEEVALLRDRFKTDFENLAQKILDEKSAKFTEQNKLNIDQVLMPLRENLTKFEKQVNDAFMMETREKATLKEQIQQLAQMNQQMSADAMNLVKALKGDNKAAGNWGEVILERLLEQSGLQEGVNYLAQGSFKDEDGNARMPDVVVTLPGDKHIVVDSKVSLVSYTDWVAAESDDDRLRAEKAFATSVWSHVRGLSDKNYATLYGINSPDFVLLFMPIEPAYAMVLRADSSLWQNAYDRKIIIVSPTTLMATLTTVANIWRQEQGIKNAEKIAEEAGKLYDKLYGFVEDFEKVGKQMDTLRNTYASADNKLRTGSGNVLRRAEQMKKLGAKATKRLGGKDADADLDDDSEE